MAVAIVLGATSMNDITLLAHHAAVLGPEPSDTTVRRTLELADPRTLDKVARVRAAVRAHVWSLIAATPAGFPWLAVAGKLLAGWLVIDLDGTLITAHSDKEGAAPMFKKEFHGPLRGPAVADENWVPPRRRRAAGWEPAGVSRCPGWRRAGWKVHCRGCVPPVVSGRLWTGRGRKKDWDRGPLPGNPRCIFVSVCQSPVLTGALAGGARARIWMGGWPLQEVAGVKVLHERVAGIDVHKDMVKVAIRSPGDKPWTRKTGVFEFRTFYGVLQEMARFLREREVTHVVMEASGVYTEPVYHALCEQDFTEVIVVNPAHVKALKGHKTDARDCARLAGLLECGLLRGSFVPPAEQKELRDLTRYRTKTVQARTSEIQRLQKALESAGIKLGSVASDITGKSATAMIEALIDGERRTQVMADLALRSLRQPGKQADLKMALAGRFTEHHAMLCRMHRDQVKLADP